MSTAGPARPAVSVLMLAYNHANYVKQAMASVFAQDAQFPIEVIVADDASTDGTGALLMAMEPPAGFTYRPVIRERNLGMHASFADAWSRCSGRLIAVLECDDYWTDPAKLRLQHGAFGQNPEMTLCGTGVRAVEKDGAPRGERWPRAPLPITLEALIQANEIQTCSVMYRAGVVPVIPSWIGRLRMADWPLNLLHAFRGDIGMVERDCAEYRVHGGGVWSSQQPLDRLVQSERALALVERYGSPDQASGRALRGQRIALAREAVEEAKRSGTPMDVLRRFIALRRTMMWGGAA